MNKEEIINILINKFPTARAGFIEVLYDALELHSKKNADYVSTDFVQKYNHVETVAKFLDIRRKYSRLENIIVNEHEVKVDEKLEDTVIDLGNYAFLFAEYIANLKNI